MSAEDHDLLIEMHGLVKRIDKHLFGNGQPSICQMQSERIEAVGRRTSSLERWRSSVMGVVKSAAWATGTVLVLVGIAVSVWTKFH